MHSIKQGAFTFVLHSHIPYCRGAGRWPHGEEWLHEAAIGTYLPLLQTLYRLADEGCPFHLTIGITPVLMEQLADPLVLDNLDVFIQEKIAATTDANRFQRQGDAARDHNISGASESEKREAYHLVVVTRDLNGKIHDQLYWD